MILFLALKIGKTVPKLFLDFCHSAKLTGSTETVPLFYFASANIKITVQIPGCGDLRQNEKVKKIIEKHKNSLKKDLCKIRKHLIKITILLHVTILGVLNHHLLHIHIMLMIPKVWKLNVQVNLLY